MIRVFIHCTLILLSAGGALCTAVRAADAITRAAGDVRTGSAGSYVPMFSGNGQRLVFLSAAVNLVTNHDAAMLVDVFSYDLVADRTTLVSANALGVGGDLHSSQASVSSTGDMIAFTSRAGNLLTPPTNRFGIYVRNLSASQTVFMPGGDPILSENGRYLAFLSSIPGPLPDTSSWADVFVMDLQSNSLEVASVNAQGTATADWQSGLIQMSADGRKVLFWSLSTNILSPNLPSWQFHIYLRDLDAGVTHWIDTNAAAFSQTAISLGATLSKDTRFAVYLSQIGRIAFHHEVLTATTLLIASNVAQTAVPQITADGKRVTYGDGTNIFIWDHNTQTNELVSIALDGTTPGDGISHSPLITPDGRYICFLSAATNLVTNAVNGRLQVYVRDLLSGVTHLASLSTNAGGCNRDINGYPAITADGQRIAFASIASDIVPDDFNAASDIFLYDRSTGTTKAISRRLENCPARTATGMSRLWPGSVSSNGQVVAFTSQDNSLAANDTNRLSDILVYDAPTSAMAVVNPEPTGDASHPSVTEKPMLSRDGRRLLYFRRTHAAPQPPQNDSGIVTRDPYWRDLATGFTVPFTNSDANVSLSGDGRWVGFHSISNAVTLSSSIPLDQNNAADAFVRDMETGSNILVSWRFDMTRTANAVSSNVVVAPNGRWVIFQSRATDVVSPQLTLGPWRLFVRDLFSNRVNMIDERSLGAFGPVSHEADFSSDSRFAAVAWLTAPPVPLINPNAMLYDFQARTSTSVCQRCRAPSLSEDGRFVAYETTPANGETKQVFVKSIASGLVKLLSGTATGNPGNKHSTTPQITPDGRFIIFESKASDLVPNDTNDVSDIFLADRLQGTLMMLSVNQSGAPADNISSVPVLSDDGRSLYFQSFASDLVEGDYNFTRDIFLLRLSEPDTDSDGMDDDWEAAFFGDLSRGGTGDFDADGHNDLQEFLAGTNPANDASILRVLTLTRLQGGARSILWSAVPGRSYRVQYKNNVSQTSWTDLPSIITATSSTASATDDTSSGVHRFYRVLLIL